MTTSGMMPAEYKSMLLPGVMAISMVLSGVQAVAMPLITEFQFTREIEDRLLAPIETGWLAVEKIVAGMIQAMVAGLVVIPAAWLIMGSGVKLEFRQAAGVRGWCACWWRFIVGGRAGAGVQHRADADRADVQPGAGADDDVRLRLLSVERAGGVSHFADTRCWSIRWCMPARDCAGRWSPQLPHINHDGRDRRAGGAGRHAAGGGAEEVQWQSGKLNQIEHSVTAMPQVAHRAWVGEHGGNARAIPEAIEVLEMCEDRTACRDAIN